MDCIGRMVMRPSVSGERESTCLLCEPLPKAFPDPLKALGILRRDISSLFLQPTRTQESAYMFNPREVILSSYLVNAETSRIAIHQI
jgi:hypothetical protein